jgi:hypothetical protein
LNRNEVIETIQYIKGAFGNRFEINENTPNVWLDVLKDLPFEPVMEYVRGCAMEQDFPPSLADLKRAAGETQSQRYHQGLRESALERFDNLDEWEKNAAPPPPGNREKVLELCRPKPNSRTAQNPSEM